MNISLPLENKTGVQSGDQILCQKLMDGLRNLNLNEPEKKEVILMGRKPKWVIICMAEQVCI